MDVVHDTPPHSRVVISEAVLSNHVRAGKLIALILLRVGPAMQAQHVVDQGTVIEDVTLISPERAAPLHHAHVVLRDGRIAEIGTKLAPGSHARRVDGRPSGSISSSRTWGK